MTLESVGEAYGLPEPRVTATIIGSRFAPMLLGRDAGTSEALREPMFGAQACAGLTAGRGAVVTIDPSTVDRSVRGCPRTPAVPARPETPGEPA
ncbi:hypothetical protein AB0K00_53495 [Dactylosporangium sp. NPDC049525]|uniref:hypothetical protein n=1 Tax=Dactylosporangium sp. NPDC049525 TaxID=3154730 RepID=UPI00344302D3